MADASDVIGEFAARVTAGQISWAGDFSATMSAIEHTLTVRLIMARPLVTLGENQRVAEVLDEDSNALFDCFPVRGKGQAVVGAVFREDAPLPDALAADVMRPLHDVPLIESGQPIEEFMARMRDTERLQWLVVHGAEICGIVTRSDLARLPVRLLLTIRLVRLEQLAGERIRSLSGNDDWVRHLSEQRRANALSLAEQDRSTGDDLDLINYINFTDKKMILEALATETDDRKDAKSLGGLIEMRNELMHGRERDIDHASAKKILERTARIDALIAKWSGARGSVR